MIRLLWHVYRKGHSVTTRRVTIGLRDTSRGWVQRCSCGYTVYR